MKNQARRQKIRGKMSRRNEKWVLKYPYIYIYILIVKKLIVLNVN